MTIQDRNELAGKLIEYDMELSKRDAEAVRAGDIEKMSKILDIKNHIARILEALDEER
jgi:hypothetical protein